LATQNENAFSKKQLVALQKTFQRGADHASEALAKWIGRPSIICVESVEQLPLENATGVLGLDDEPICFCCAEMSGALTGELILAFDEASGLALADMLLDQPAGTASSFGDMEVSAVLETMNIISCAYFNALSRTILRDEAQTKQLLPSPPRFNRDFAESLVQFALMDQAVIRDQVVLSRTQFRIDGEIFNWTLLLVPDAESMQCLHRWLPANDRRSN
jgi:chemotaxis protein CheC